MPDLAITKTLTIPLDELRITAIRASGPGGQHVNKSSTAVQVRFDVRRSPSLDEGVRNRLLALAGNRVNNNGELVVTAQRFRSRKQNRQDALNRIARLVRRATFVPKTRRKTKPSAASRRRRLEDKRRRGNLKKMRGKPGRD